MFADYDARDKTAAVESVLTALSNRSCNPKRKGDQWSARCPAHEDSRPSLSISVGNDGRALVCCHAGCTLDEICHALGLAVTDLMADAASTEFGQARGKPQYRRQDNGKPVEKTYDSAEAAIEALERKFGPRSAMWTYHDAHGEPVGVIVRWNKADGKDFRPVSRRGNGWIVGGMPDPRSLYRLPNVLDSDQIFICEGEQAADAACAIGLTATTSAHGSQSPDKTDWSPLAGKQCVVLPDNDTAGSVYADVVTAILTTLTHPAVVKVLELPNLPEKGDMDDWVKSHGDADIGELRRQVEALADQVEPVHLIQKMARIERFKPFPTNVLPRPIRDLVVSGAKSIGCDETMVVLPLFAGLASAIGTTRRIRLKEGWCEPAVLWTAIVAESGSHKSPAQDLALRPLRQLQAFLLEEYPELQELYERNILLYDADLRTWRSKGRRKGEPPPDKPEEPSVARYLVNDVTLEALAEQLSKNQRGLLCDCDELAGWLGSFDQYRGGKGADVSKWLSMHRAEQLLIDRKTGPIKNLFIKYAAVSITGGIQPMTLRRALGDKHFENGLAARMLLSAPPKRRKVWNTACVGANVTGQVEKIFARLLALRFGTDSNDSPAPIDLPLTIEGRQVWVEFYEEHARRQFEATGNYASALAKLEAVAARLALIMHLVRCAADDPSLDSPDAVDATSMRSGVVMAEWFTDEVRRVYAVLDETDDEREQRRLIEWIERKGGSVTARDVQQGCRWLRESGVAELALNELAKAGCGRWEPDPSGRRGQPTRRFVLSTVSTVYGNGKISEENSNTVDVDNANVSKPQPNDESGEL